MWFNTPSRPPTVLTSVHAGQHTLIEKGGLEGPQRRLPGTGIGPGDGFGRGGANENSVSQGRQSTSRRGGKGVNQLRADMLQTRGEQRESEALGDREADKSAEGLVRRENDAAEPPVGVEVKSTATSAARLDGIATIPELRNVAEDAANADAESVCYLCCSDPWSVSQQTNEHLQTVAVSFQGRSRLNMT
jgi:hypothetical protein